MTFDQSDELTWPDQKKTTYLPTYLPTYQPTYPPTHLPTNLREPSRSDPRHLWQLRHLISSDDLTFRVFSNEAIIGTCDICNTDYNTDNWEPGLMTINCNTFTFTILAMFVFVNIQWKKNYDHAGHVQAASWYSVTKKGQCHLQEFYEKH